MLSNQLVASNAANSDRQRQFTNFVLADWFPCVGARSSINCAHAVHQNYARPCKLRSVQTSCANLQKPSTDFHKPEERLVTFMAMFGEVVNSESEFKCLMWKHLQLMHPHDSAQFEWDQTVSADPADANFSFSTAGRALFVAGLSPFASPVARRSPAPCIIFNFHDQFEALRDRGKYASPERVVRNRDFTTQGSINPMLDMFGEASEARQYSGCKQSAWWKCPFIAETSYER